ncbi:hypothetical protein BD410DRAFT_901118 [Rickenella mellea]|uniref:Transmembrane protein n=1 Tax=Rickenella mellea TaxID=50990 RepID=A0A4Y7PSP0_9AGAM|nr:hypothetical protein BD410DRAFT_901118 [Rickenella mellea]
MHRSQFLLTVVTLFLLITMTSALPLPAIMTGALARAKHLGCLHFCPHAGQSSSTNATMAAADHLLSTPPSASNLRAAVMGPRLVLAGASASILCGVYFFVTSRKPTVKS